MLQNIFIISQPEKSWLDIIQHMVFPIVTIVGGWLFGYWTHKLNKQKWVRNNWDIYIKNYKTVVEAFGVIGSLGIPIDKNQWMEKDSGNLVYGNKVKRDIDRAVELIWRARDEAKLLLEEKIYKYLEKLKNNVVNLDDLYVQYKRTLFPNTILNPIVNKDLLLQERKELSKKIDKIISTFLKEDYTLVYRQVMALKK